ncbi:MAG: hypothetical protein U9N54_07565 [candidate division Zixibacteria bacterium]|nr:hypothetical protein [candidate division Zixibacteria bacterium]
MKKFIIAIFVIIMLIAGCSDTNNPTDSNTVVDLADQYIGRMVFTKSYAPPIYDYRISYTDSVVLIITDNTYILNVNGNQTKLCSSTGTIEANTQTGFITLTLKASMGENCDSKRLPNGVFEAEFSDSSLEFKGDRVISWMSNELEITDTLEFDFDFKIVK